jgi:hypothetical protein
MVTEIIQVKKIKSPLVFECVLVFRQIGSDQIDVAGSFPAQNTASVMPGTLTEKVRL